MKRRDLTFAIGAAVLVSGIGSLHAVAQTTSQPRRIGALGLTIPQSLLLRADEVIE